MSDTLASISEDMKTADARLKELSDQTAWFKAQRDHWRGQLEFALASAKVRDTGPATKSKEAALVAVTNESSVALEWAGVKLNLPDTVKLCDAAYDLVNQRYEYYTSHLMTLMARNKNVMIDYNSGKGY